MNNMNEVDVSVARLRLHSRVGMNNIHEVDVSVARLRVHSRVGMNNDGSRSRRRKSTV